MYNKNSVETLKRHIHKTECLCHWVNSNRRVANKPQQFFLWTFYSTVFRHFLSVLRIILFIIHFWRLLLLENKNGNYHISTFKMTMNSIGNLIAKLHSDIMVLQSINWMSDGFHAHKFCHLDVQSNLILVHFGWKIHLN